MNYLYGYVTSRSFSSLYIPVPAQNSTLREYSFRNNFIFVLPPLESFYENCYHQLFGLIHELKVDSNIVMYSLLMLPIFNVKKFNQLMLIASYKNIKFHFVLENFSAFSNEPLLINEITNYKLNTFKTNIVNINKYF